MSPVVAPDAAVALAGRRALAVSAGATGAAAVLGNAFIGKDSLAWFRALRQPRGMPPFGAFLAVGAAYYVLMGTVLHRSLRRSDRRATALALTVLTLNEAWNAALFGRRSTRNGFFGTVAFTLPLAGLGVAAREDRLSRRLVEAYGAWVAYDLWWSYGLWRLNPDG
jgi:tryptophan-rich sensory protein